MKIALLGNPNCGKTTMFNALTGANQYVGNWPGVTVEKKEGKLKKDKEVDIIDLPGVYSLSPYTLEEVITRNYIIDEKPDVIINIVDASNIERNLYLTTQAIELDIPIVVALNMMDIVKKNGTKIDTEVLKKRLGCNVVEISALKEEGIDKLISLAIESGNNNSISKEKVKLSYEVNKAIEGIESIIRRLNINNLNNRWLAVKLFEKDEEVIKKYNISNNILEEVNNIILTCEKKMDDDSESIMTGERYEYISAVISKSVVKKDLNKETVSDKIDKIVTNRFLALPIFAMVMFSVYYIAVSSLGTIVTDWTNDVLFGEIIQENISAFLESIAVSDWLQGLVVDGLIGGVGAVLGFVPQIMILFFLLSILEDCGYMSRIAFIMDRIFRRFGLSGKSFIPMLVGSGCGVPGIMASRTIENERDRKMTIMLTTFIPCGAKIPIIALFAGALFGGSPWIAPSMYFLGISMIIICGIILKQTRLFSGEPASFVMELPQYHIPSMKGVLIHMWDRAKAFIIKAGTVIFVACGVIWFLQSFNWQLNMVDANESILASIGNLIAPIFAPLGFGSWEATVATVTGLVAKENVVGTFGVILGVAEATEEDPALLSNIAGMFTISSAYAFMAFNMLCAPCFAAIGAIKREMGSWKWTWITIAFQTTVAYIVALLVNQIGSFVLEDGSAIGVLISIVIVIFSIIFPIVRGKIKNKNYNKIEEVA